MQYRFAVIYGTLKNNITCPGIKQSRMPYTDQNNSFLRWHARFYVRPGVYIMQNTMVVEGGCERPLGKKNQNENYEETNEKEEGKREKIEEKWVKT